MADATHKGPPPLYTVSGAYDGSDRWAVSGPNFYELCADLGKALDLAAAMNANHSRVQAAAFGILARHWGDMSGPATEPRA